MESRRSSRLRLAVNDSGKQRLTRFIKRNLDLIKINICTKRANTAKNCSRTNPNEMSKSLERANSCKRKADSTEPLKVPASSSKIPDLTEGKYATLKKPDVPSVETESKWVSSESGEPLKNAGKPIRKPAAMRHQEKPHSSQRSARRLVPAAPPRNKDGTSNKTEPSKRKARPSAGEWKQKAGKPGMSSRKSDSTMNNQDVSSMNSNSERIVIGPEESESPPVDSNSINKKSNSPTRKTVESSIITSSSADNSFYTAKTSNFSVRNSDVPSRKTSSLSANADDTTSNILPKTNSSAESASVSLHESNSPAYNSDVFPSEHKTCVNLVLESESDSEVLEMKSEPFLRNPDVLVGKPSSPATIPSGLSEGSRSFAKSNSPAANSVISIMDSDSCSVNTVDSSQSESSDSSLSDSDEDTRKSDPSDASANRLDSLSRNISVPSGKPAAPEKNSPTKSEYTAAPIQFNSSKKPSDLQSKKFSDIEEPDLGLDTLKRTMVELFTSGDSSKTLPFINRNWPEKSNSCKTKKLPDPRNRNPTDERPSTDFLSLIDLKTNRYYVQCQLDEVERETMNYVARRWNWSRDPEIFPDTKYVIVKEESFDEDFAGIPENILKANAFGGCVLLFKYVQECAAEDELLHIKERHIPSHQGTRRKMLGRYRLTPMFDGFAFFITPEISGAGRHERDFALLRNLLRLTHSKLCSTLEELRESPETNKVALRSTARSELEGVVFVHYHWLYECILNRKLYPLEPYTSEFTRY